MFKTIPLIYSCSGCSNLAQTANEIAVTLNQERVAEMSCIAGVGGNVRSLVKKAQSNRPIIVVDGCQLACAKACLSQHQITPQKHIVLTDYGHKKVYNQKVSKMILNNLLIEVREVANNMEAEYG